MGVEPTIAAERRRSTVLKTAMVTGPPALPCSDSKGIDGIVVMAPVELAIWPLNGSQPGDLAGLRSVLRLRARCAGQHD